MSRKPDFLIAGMAKCGTTSLAAYLQQHPEVFITEHKEPRFITSACGKFPEGGPKDHLVKDWYVKDWDEYLSLFENATETVAGEASADTLYFYKDTIPVIKKYLGDPQIILILRNPVKRAFSAYTHLVRDQREALSFESAVDAEPNRIKDNWELIYHYKSVSMYYDCVKAFMDNFTNVKVVINEDLRKKPRETMHELFRFLGVSDNLDINTNQDHNVSGMPKSQVIHNSLQSETWLRKAVRPLARLIFPTEELRSSAVAWLSAKNIDRMTIPPVMEDELYAYFREDVEKMEGLLGRELKSWKRD